MGYQLYRMIRDGAPPEWTGPMVHVAGAIADDARDPDGTQDDLPWSAMPVQGHFDSRGRWRDGLTERTGMSARAVSRALTDLARAGYDMRQPAGLDKQGRPVFAMKGHSLRFWVPPLTPRPQPQSTPSTATFDHVRPVDGESQSPPSTATFNGQRSPDPVSKPAKYGDPVPSESPQEDLSPQSPEAEVADGSLEVPHATPRNEQRSPRTVRETQDEARRQAEELRAAGFLTDPDSRLGELFRATASERERDREALVARMRRRPA